MKKLNSKFLGLILILIFILVSTNVQALPNIDTLESNPKLIKDMLLKRTKLIKQGLFETKDLDVLKEELMKLEKGEILINDMRFLEELRENPIDLEYPENMEITALELLEKNEDRLIYKASILWSINSQTNDYDESIDYRLSVICDNKKYYIVEIKPFDI